METNNVLYVLLMLLLTLFVFCILMLVLKKLKTFTPKLGEGIKIQGGASIGNKSKLLVVEADGQKLLLGVTELQINTLHVYKDQQPIAREQFSAHLENRLNG